MNSQEYKFDRGQIARQAKQEGYVPIIDLVGILADDLSYIEILPRLKEKYIPTYSHVFFPKDADLSTFRGRHTYWMHLVRRWGGMEADVIKTRQPGFKYLSCYFRDKKTHGAFVPIDREEQIPEYLNQNHYIKLTEFAEHLKIVENVLDIKIPFPRVLLLSRRVRYSYDSKTMANAEEEAILRNKEVEEHIWQTAIDPLLRKCGLNFEFKYIEGDYSDLDVWKVTKLSVNSCNGLQEIKSVFEILVSIQEGISISDDVKNRLGGFFHKLFSDENDGNLLPAFIELVSQHAGLYTDSKDVLALENRIGKGDPMPNFETFILEYGKAAESLYDCMKIELKNYGKTVTNANDKERRDATFKVYNANPPDFHPIKAEFIELAVPYSVAEKQKRYFIGKILQQAIMRNAGGFEQKDYQSLYETFITINPSAPIRLILSFISLPMP